MRSLAEWNRPVYWPLAVLAVVLLAMAWGARKVFRGREQHTARDQARQLGLAD